MSSGYLLFDIGATESRLAFAHTAASFEPPLIVATDTRVDGFDIVLAHMREVVSGRTVKLAAGGLAGSIDRKHGRMVRAPNLPLWNGLDFAGRIRHEFHAPTRLENDTAVVGLGEAVHGAGQGAAIAVYLTFSTGVNGVRLVDGRIDSSAQGFDIGYQVMSLRGGATTSLEDMVGGHNLQRRYGKSPKALAMTSTWYEVERTIVAGIYNTMLYWSPERIVIGGGMSHDLDIKRLGRLLGQLPPVFDHLPELERASLGDIGGLYGALVLASQAA